MKAQNCPLCGSETEEQFYDVLENYCSCKNESCLFSSISPVIETWNRIRIAPDGKNVDQWSEDEAYEPWHFNVIFKEWMNPRYPDDT